MSSYEMMDENEMLENSEMPENNEMMENNEAAGQEQRGEAMGLGYSAYGERPRYSHAPYSEGWEGRRRTDPRREAREAATREWYTRTRNGHKEKLERAKFGLEPIPKEVMGGRTETGAEQRKEAAEGGEANGERTAADYERELRKWTERYFTGHRSWAEELKKKRMEGKAKETAEQTEGGEAMGYSSGYWKHELECAIANGNEIAAKNAKKNYASALVREGKYK